MFVVILHHPTTPNLDKPEPNRKTFTFTEWNY